MKKNKPIYLLLLLLTLLTGCSDESEMITPEYDTIRFFSTISRNTRMTGSAFESNDRIGVFIVPYASDNTSPGLFPDGAHEYNVELLYNGVNWNSLTGSSLVWPGIRAIDVYGYYPYNESSSDFTSGQYMFNVQADQSTQSLYMQSDFLWAKAEQLFPVKEVQLTFYHRLSQITVNVLSQIQTLTKDTQTTQVSLMNISPTATVSMTDGVVSADTSESGIEVSSFPLSETETDFDASFSTIIPPQTISQDNRFIKIKLGGITYYYQPTESITLESGKNFVFNIIITKQGVEVTTSVAEWQDGGITEGNIGEKAPDIIDLNAIDWNKSQVHNVYNKGVRVAQVAKEYLFKSTGLIDAQAIVVYPIGVDGEADLTQGFVAQVMNRDRNLTTGLYTSNTKSIHGGSVSFNTSNNTMTSYIAGSSALINKIQIGDDASLLQADDNAIALLTTSPMLLTDIDNNSYPIAKIGTQYWISENFRAEHYNNGDDLQYYYYNNDISNKSALGALYAWSTVTDSRGISPEGWRVPVDEDWWSAYRYLTPNAGKKLKANSMWSNLSYNDNVTGFSGLPTGRRTNTGTYTELYNYGQWWTTTLYGSTTAYRLYLDYGNSAMHLTTLNINYTQSLRLIRDTPL